MLNPSRTLLSPGAETSGLEGLSHPAMRDCAYRGERTPQGQCRVWVESKRADGTIEATDLPPCPGAGRENSVDYAWGSIGSGSTELALSLLTEALGDRELALRHYLEFQRAHVVGWSDQWRITAEEIRFFVLKQATAPTPPARFSPGSIHVTPGILENVSPDDVRVALRRHLSGDWGQLSTEDWQSNDNAVLDGTRLISAYMASNGVKFWIITEADRSSTTALLPEEY